MHRTETKVLKFKYIKKKFSSMWRDNNSSIDMGFKFLGKARGCSKLKMRIDTTERWENRYFTSGRLDGSSVKEWILIWIKLEILNHVWITDIVLWV